MEVNYASKISRSHSWLNEYMNVDELIEHAPSSGKLIGIMMERYVKINLLYHRKAVIIILMMGQG